MKVFVIKDKYGCAVIKADSATEALRILQKYERDEVLSFRKTADDFQELQMGSEGVIFYVCE